MLARLGTWACCGAICGAAVYVACRLLWFILTLGSRHDLMGSALMGAAIGAIGTVALSALPTRSWFRFPVGGAVLAAGAVAVLFMATPPHLRLAFDRQSYLESLRVSLLFHFLGSTATLVLAAGLVSWLASCGVRER